MQKINLNNTLTKLRKKVLTDIGLNGEERNKWIISTIKNIPAGKKILDAGAGECQFKKYCDHLTYTSQDFGQYNGSGDKTGIQMDKWDNSKLDIVCDITKIPVEDNSFDVILCTEVFEHIPDPISALKEFSRILKKDGQLILTAPFGSMTHFAPYHFYTGFNRYFYNTHLSNFGFEITELHSNGSMFDYIAQDIKTFVLMAQKYSGKKVGIFQKAIVLILLRILNKHNKYDKGSNELLCFGYQVCARKIR